VEEELIKKNAAATDLETNEEGGQIHIVRLEEEKSKA
jgi:hypothetical protein